MSARPARSLAKPSPSAAKPAGKSRTPPAAPPQAGARPGEAPAGGDAGMATVATVAQVQELVALALRTTRGRRGWKKAAPDPSLIVTRTDAISALAGMVQSIGLEPATVLAGILNGEPADGAAPPPPRRPPARYERSGGWSWRTLLRDALAGQDGPMTAAEITARVAAIRGVETGGDRDYRFVERCVGAMLSRYRGSAIDPSHRLVLVDDKVRGKLYALEAIPARRPHSPRSAA